jgi:hypothetical protein
VSSRAGTTLDEARAIALSLPEAVEAPHFQATSFRVRGKIFATSQDAATLNVFVGEEARGQALALHPGFIEKLPWGAKIVGLRLHLARAPKDVVGALIRQAWRAKAPKALQ